MGFRLLAAPGRQICLGYSPSRDFHLDAGYATCPEAAQWSRRQVRQ
jgi:hypothetical protein